MTAPLYRGHVLAIVVPDGTPVAPTVAALRDQIVSDADVKVTVADHGSGVSASNVAAAVDKVDYLAFVAAGVTVPPGFLADCVEVLRNDLSTGLVGWSPGGLARPELDLFVDGRAYVARHSAFHAVAGFDAEVEPRLSHLDLGWRLWMAGYRVRSIGPPPDAWTGSAPTTEGGMALLSALLDDSSLGAAWTTPAGQSARRRAAGRRWEVQSIRQRGDGELLPLVHAGIRRWADVDPSVAPLVSLLEEWGAPERAGSRRRIAVVTTDTLAARMAGPGIRAVHIARALAAEHDVVLASTGSCDLSIPGVEVRQVGERGLREVEHWCDVFVFQGFVLAGRPHLARSHKVMVVDLYDPMHLEQLEQAHDAPGERGRFEVVHATAGVINEQMDRADFMLCASAKQRDLWIGQLAGLGRVNPVTYDGDESLRRLLAIVPFGVSDDPPVQRRSAIRGVVPGIGPDDKVILWGGGVYNWFDPLTLVRAVDRLRERIPEVRLFFLGMKHPNPGVPKMRVAYETQELARSLGLMGTHVFFNDEWVEFDDRQNFLLDADLGVSTHLDHIETEFSFRTRILDYLWAGLPIVATDGDSFASIISRDELGLVVPPNDVEALERALERLLTDAELGARCRVNIARVSPDLRWSTCLEPLLEFCRSPHRAADIACPDLDRHARISRVARGRRRDLELAMSYLRAGAIGVVLRRVRSRLKAALT